MLSETKPASEYIDGEIIEKHKPQGQHSTIQLELASYINTIRTYALTNNSKSA